MNATTPLQGVPSAPPLRPLPPPLPGTARRPPGGNPVPSRGHPVWTVIALASAVTGVVLAYVTGMTHPPADGTNTVFYVETFVAGGLGALAGTIGIVLLAATTPRGWQSVAAILAVTLAGVAGFMAAVLLFSG